MACVVRGPDFVWLPLAIELPGGRQLSISARIDGDGPWLTLLHGFGSLRVHIRGVLLLNCALYPEAYRPVLAQQLLLKRFIGPIFSRPVNWPVLRKEYSSIFAPDRIPSVAQFREFWSSILHRNGKRNYHLLIRYIPERVQERPRWEPVPAATPVPIRYLWGMLDPINGRSMMTLMKQRIGGVDSRELDAVGHCPHLEAPEIVAKELLALPDRVRPATGLGRA